MTIYTDPHSSCSVALRPAAPSPAPAEPQVPVQSLIEPIAPPAALNGTTAEHRKWNAARAVLHELALGDRELFQEIKKEWQACKPKSALTGQEKATLDQEIETIEGWFVFHDPLFDALEADLCNLNEQTASMERGNFAHLSLNAFGKCLSQIETFRQLFETHKQDRSPALALSSARRLESAFHLIQEAVEDFQSALAGLERIRARAVKRAKQELETAKTSHDLVKAARTAGEVQKIDREYRAAVQNFKAIQLPPTAAKSWRQTIGEFAHAVMHPIETLCPTMEEQTKIQHEKILRRLQAIGNRIPIDVKEPENFSEILGKKIKAFDPRAFPHAFERERDKVRTSLALQELQIECGVETVAGDWSAVRAAALQEHFPLDAELQEMSERQKRWLSFFLYGLQLQSSVAGFVQSLKLPQVWKAQIEKEIERLQKETPREIARGASLIGTTLTDKPTSLSRMDDEKFEAYTKRNPDVRPFLEPYRCKIGPFTKAEIDSVVERYQRSQLMRAAGEKFRPMSLGEWWKAFADGEGGGWWDSLVQSFYLFHARAKLGDYRDAIVKIPDPTLREQVSIFEERVNRGEYAPELENEIDEKMAQAQLEIEFKENGEELQGIQGALALRILPQIEELEKDARILSNGDELRTLFQNVREELFPAPAADAHLPLALQVAHQRELISHAEKIRGEEKIAHLRKAVAQKLEEERSLLQLNALLSQKRYVGERLFQHILGDHFGSGTGLEGYYYLGMLRSILEMIQDKVQFLDSHPLCDRESRLSICRSLGLDQEPALFRRLADQFKTAEQLNGSGLLKHFKTKVLELKEGNSFFFQGGWHERESGGHSVIYEVIRNANDLFTFRIYNRGAGVTKYQTNAILAVKKHHLPFAEIEQVPMERLTSPVFLKVLEEFQKPPPSGDEWNETDLFETIRHLLGGKTSSKVYTADQLMEQLQVGHCTYLAFTGLIAQHLGSSERTQRWEFELQFRTLDSFFWLQQQNLPKNERLRRLTRKGAEQFARNARVAFEKGVISLPELTLANEKVRAIEKAVDEAHQIALRKAEEKSSFTLAKRMPQPDWGTWTDFLKLRKPPDPNQPVAVSDIPVLDLSTYNFREPKELLPNLVRLGKEIGALSPVRQKEAIQEAVFQIPVDFDAAPLSSDEKGKLISFLVTISIDYINTMTNRHGNKRTHPLEYLTQIKLLALADSVSRQWGLDLPDLYQWDMGYVLEARSAASHLFDPRWEDQVRQLRDYWKTRRTNLEDTNSFFGVEKFPICCDGGHRPVSDDHNPWKDIAWMKQFVQRPEFREKIKQRFPQLAAESPLMQAIVMTCETVRDEHQQILFEDAQSLRKELIPRPFFDLRALSYLTDAAFNGHLNRPIHDLMSEINAVYDSNAKKWGLLKPILQFYSSHSETDLRRAGLYYADRNHFLSAIDPAPLSETLQLFHDEKEQAIVEPIGQKSHAPFKRRIDPQRQRYLYPSDFKPDLSLEETRELLALNGLGEQQIIETLSYFQRHPHHLEDPGFQNLFKKLIFEPPLLIERLRQSPESARAIAESAARFCSNWYATYAHLGKIPTALFLLEVSDLFLDAIDFVGISSDGFPQIREEASKLLAAADLSDRDQTLLWREVQVSYRNEWTIDAEGIADFLASTIWLKRAPLKPDDPAVSGAKEEWQSDLYERFKGEIQGGMKGPERDRILNGIVARLSPGKAASSWTAQGQRFTSTDAASVIDLHYMKFFEPKNGLRRTNLFNPNRHPILQSLFQSQIEAVETSEGVYEFQNERGEAFKLLDMGFNETPLIQRKIGAEWVQYSDSLKVSRNVLPGSLHSAYAHYWVALEAAPKPTQTNFFTALWQQAPARKAWISHRKTGQWLYEVEGTEAEDDYRPSAIHALDEKGQRKKGVLSPRGGNTAAYLGEWVTQCAVPDFLHIWIDPDSRSVLRIEMPLFDLDFEVRDGKAYSSQMKGYFLSANHFVKSLGDAEHVLVLEKEGGDQKLAIIPRLPYDKSESSLETPGRVIRPSYGDTPALISYFVYDFLPNGQLKPRSVEGRLYLAMIHLWEQDYDQAFDVLTGLGSQLTEYSKSESQIIDLIVDLQKNNGDSDPRAIAIRLKATAMFFMNAFDFTNGYEGGVLDSTIDLYDLWIQKRDQIPPRFRLTEEEEKLLQRATSNVSTPSPLIAARAQGASKAPEHFSVESIPDSTPSWYTGVTGSFMRWGVVNHSLLRADGLSWNIRSLYADARNSHTLETIGRLFQTVTGMEPPTDLSLEQLTVELSHALKFIFWKGYRGEFFDHSNALSALLLMLVLKNPADFPSVKEFEEKISDTKWYEERLRPLLRRFEWQGNPYLPRSRHTLVWFEATQKIAPSLEASSAPPECAAPTPPSDVSLPRLPDGILIPQQPSVDAVQSLQRSAQELLSLFDVKTEDVVANDEFQNLRRMVIDYGDSPAALRPGYVLADRNRLTQSRAEFWRESKEVEDRLQKLETELLSLANAESPREIERQMIRSELASTDRRLIRVEELIYLFLRKDMEKLGKRNPALSEEQIRTVYVETQEYLVLATRLQHLERLLDQIAKVETDGTEQDLETLAAINAEQRAYKIKEHPEELALEYFRNILLRKDQTILSAHFDADYSGMGPALEMKPGKGKTSVFLPLTAMRKADGDRTVVLVMPEALIPSMSAALQETLKESADQAVDLFTFERNQKYGVAQLERIRDRLRLAREEGKAVILSDTSFQTFFLVFIERFLNRSPKAELDLFREIFTQLGKTGEMTLDELDTLFDVLRAVQFTRKEPEPLSKELANITADFYRLITTHPQICAMIKWNFSPVESGVPFTALYYEQKIKPLIIETILKGEFGYEDRSLAEYLVQLSDEEKARVGAYLASQANYQFVADMPDLIRDALAALKEEISKLTPLSAPKKVNEHYGPLPEDVAVPRTQSPFMAIPYHGSNHPAIRSLHGTDLESIHYTIQMHIALGVHLVHLKKEVAAIAEKIIDELKHGRIQSLGESKWYQRFKELGGTERMKLFEMKDRDWDQMRLFINQKPALLLHFIRKYILSDLKIHHSQLHTNAHILPLLVKVMKGCSGTLWNRRSYPAGFGKYIPSDTEASTLLLLWKNAPHQIEILEQNPRTIGVRATLQKLYKSGSFADLGGIFSGISNRVVAREMLSLTPEAIRGVVFYDENDRLVVFVKGKSDPVPLSESGLTRDQVVAYWAQKNTTGSDIKLAPQMHAVNTVGRHTTMRDLIQAAWRLRELDRGQRVSYAILAEDAAAIRETLLHVFKRTAGDPLTLSDLLLYVKYNEAARQGEHNIRALRFSLASVLIEPVLNLLLQSNTSFDLTEIVEELFAIDKPASLFELYGPLDGMVPREKAVQDEIQRVLNSKTMHALRTHRAFKGIDANRIESVLKGIAEDMIPFLPAQILKRSLYETEAHIELEADTNTQTNTNTQTDVNTQQQIESKWAEFSREPRTIHLWTPQQLFTEHLLTPHSYDVWHERLRYLAPLFSSKNNLPQSTGKIPVPDPVYSTPLVSVADVMAQSAVSPAAAKDVFDPELLASLNLLPVQPAILYEAEFSAFDTHADNSRYALILQDKQTGKIQYIMLDHWDALQIERLLDKEREKGAPSNIRMGLYHRDIGLYARGSEPFDPSLLDTPRFHALNAQAKFFNGELRYTPEEFQFLRKWFEEKVPDVLFSLFNEHILKWKAETKRAFPESELGKLFEKLCTWL